MAIGTKLTLGDSDLYENAALYRSTIGALQYLTLSRLDIAYCVNKLSQFLKAPTQNHWQACKRLLRYLKGTSNYGILFIKSTRINLECYTDAAWASSIEDRRSTSGCCVFLGTNLLQWTSRKQKVVALSSTKVEYRALAQESTKLAWFCSLFSELGVSLSEIPVIWCDNQSAGSLASNPVFHGRTKHIELDAYYVREQVTSHNLKVHYVSTEHQKAEIFTKALPASRFETLRLKLTVQAPPSYSSVNSTSLT
ncbi:secreted RxLR effector protein 161-like [Pistacia vera]|uniref:secreted RxLR effector protein 161-like n=1 Tax=Pistacia vera TaxID=55513 RepID=UPI001262E823|nr:secreted RxLR effector protein 161-like [Pistacia vera]